jgi:copper(I)-binding protein
VKPHTTVHTHPRPDAASQGSTRPSPDKQPLRTRRQTRSARRCRPALLAIGALTLAATFGLSACGSGTDVSGQQTKAESQTQSPTLTLEDTWAKAGSGMTAAFGTIHNPGPHPVTIVEGTSPDAGSVQLHTMEPQADGSLKMVAKAGGFVVPAGGTLTLAPGGDHIMLMDLPHALANGDDVHLTMTSADGGTFEWTVPVRSFAGADETYRPEAPSGTSTGAAQTHPVTEAGH